MLNHMHDEPTVSKRRPILILVITVGLITLGAWHYFCHLHLKGELERISNNYLREHLEDSTAIVDVQPITNLVSIQVERPTRVQNVFAQTIGDALVEFVRRELEPALERELAVFARSNIDLYAMLVPYQVSIRVENVKVGFSRVVQDVQKELVRLGYDIGQVDGVHGPKTMKAIADVQAQLGKEQDGQASQELLHTLREAKRARIK